MGSAIGWGAIAASSLVIGAALSFAREWSMRQVGYVLAFGAGALISAVSFELAAEGIEVGGAPIMAKQGKPRERILRLWLLVAAICALASLVGYLLADAVSGDGKAAIDGFAAGALLVMLIDSMIPDARKDAGRAAGLVTVLGFAVAAGLSSLS